MMRKYASKWYWLPYVLVLMTVCSPWVVADDKQRDSSEVVDRVVWNNVPIAVHLHVGKERLVRFPESVSVGVPQGLDSFLRSQSINGTVYLTAHQPFGSTRMIVRAEPAGPIYVLDVSAATADSQSPPLPMMQIMVRDPEPDDRVSDTTVASRPQWGYVALTRFAAHQLYAPARLLRNVPGIVRVPVTPTAFELVIGGQVEALPVAAWRAGNHTVTAVRLTNTTRQAIVLDPRQLRGSWLTATFQHNRLLPLGDEADSTAVYLVSDRPFDVSF